VSLDRPLTSNTAAATVMIKGKSQRSVTQPAFAAAAAADGDDAGASQWPVGEEKRPRE